MEAVFYRNEQETQISYGETLASVMKEQSIEPQQVIILTNQRYYDRFSEKVTRLFCRARSIGIFVPTKCIATTLANLRPQWISSVAFLSKSPC